MARKGLLYRPFVGLIKMTPSFLSPKSVAWLIVVKWFFNTMASIVGAKSVRTAVAVKWYFDGMPGAIISTRSITVSKGVAGRTSAVPPFVVAVVGTAETFTTRSVAVEGGIIVTPGLIGAPVPVLTMSSPAIIMPHFAVARQPVVESTKPMSRAIALLRPSS